jgi:hypothetical protein
MKNRHKILPKKIQVAKQDSKFKKKYIFSNFSFPKEGWVGQLLTPFFEAAASNS